VTRPSRIDGMLVCGVLILTLIDMEGRTKDGVPVGTAGGLACTGDGEGSVVDSDGSVEGSGPIGTSTSDRGPRTDELIEIFEVAEELDKGPPQGGLRNTTSIVRCLPNPAAQAPVRTGPLGPQGARSLVG
jgi:hypothetical protein